MLTAALLHLPLHARPTPATAVAPATSTAIHLPFERFTLPNGLRVVVAPDHHAPVVAVALWYGVGARDEPQGQHGYAHLFEHLMFNGPTHGGKGFTQLLDAMGAYHVNGVTSWDHTRYFETVPRGALERTLALEAERMQWLGDTLSQPALDRQREIVLAEKTARESGPQSSVDETVHNALLPQHHPYRHSLVGDAADLQGATLASLRDWFKRYYTPDNAVLILAGDINATQAKALVQRHFAFGPEARPRHRAVPLVAPSKPVTRAPQVVNDAVSTPWVYLAWAAPGTDADGLAALDAGTGVLGGPLGSVLDQALVKEQGLAERASAGIESYDGVSYLIVRAQARRGISAERLDAALSETLREFLARGVDADALQRVVGRDRLWTLSGLEWLGGYVGKAAMLAEGTLAADDPLQFAMRLRRTEQLTPPLVNSALRTWLSQPPFQLHVVPGPVQPAAPVAGKPAIPAAGPPAPTALVRSSGVALPPLTTTPDIRFPEVKIAALANGIPVMFVQRADVPTLRMSIRIAGGYASDPPRQRGINELMLNLLKEGTERHDAQFIAAEQSRTGSVITASAGHDASILSLQGLASEAVPAIALMGEMLRTPAFPETALVRLREQQRSRITQEALYPNAIAARRLPQALFGASHVYGGSDYGLGESAALNQVGRNELLAHHARWVQPGNISIMAVGQADPDVLVAALNRAFGDWRQSHAPARPKLTPLPAMPEGERRAMLVDMPASAQASIFFAARLSPPNEEERVALQLALDVLLEKLNTRLREKRGVSYGVQGTLDVREQAAVMQMSTQVRETVAPSVLLEMQALLRKAADGQLVARNELQGAIEQRVRGLGSRIESSADILGELQRLTARGLQPESFNGLGKRYRRQTAAGVNAALKTALASPSRWLIVGHAATLAPALEKAGIAFDQPSASSSPPGL